MTPRVPIPASTKIISAREIRNKLRDFDTKLFLFDTGTDAYLRQDDSLQVMCPLMTSSTDIHIAGPEHLKATQSSQTGLLNL